MKTAMQELIEKLNNVKPTEFCSIDTIREWSKELLEKEKEQIIDAWQKAYVTGCVVGSNDYTNENEETDNGAYYYNQTFNQNK